MSTDRLVAAIKWLEKGRAWGSQSHSDKEKFRSDLNRPESCEMSERLKTLGKSGNFQAEYEGKKPSGDRAERRGMFRLHSPRPSYLRCRTKIVLPLQRGQFQEGTKTRPNLRWLQVPDLNLQPRRPARHSRLAMKDLQPPSKRHIFVSLGRT